MSIHPVCVLLLDLNGVCTYKLENQQRLLTLQDQETLAEAALQVSHTQAVGVELGVGSVLMMIVVPPTGCQVFVTTASIQSFHPRESLTGASFRSRASKQPAHGVDELERFVGSHGES